jgi:hypothetical protein
MKALVGAERIAFTREHSRRIFVFALEREHAGAVRKAARDVFAQLPAQDFAVVLEFRQHDLANLRPRERGRRQRGTQLLVANPDDVFIPAVRRLRLRPQVEQFFRSRVERAIALGYQRIDRGRGVVGQHGFHAPQLLPFASDPRLLFRMPMVTANIVGNLGQITYAFRRHDRALHARMA